MEEITCSEWVLKRCLFCRKNKSSNPDLPRDSSCNDYDEAIIYTLKEDELKSEYNHVDRKI